MSMRQQQQQDVESRKEVKTTQNSKVEYYNLLRPYVVVKRQNIGVWTNT